MAAANLLTAFGHGYPVAGGLSQSAINDSAGTRTPLALVFCSFALALCLLFFTGLLTNLPKAVLAGIVFVAVYKLVDVRALLRMWKVSRIDFHAAAIALVSVLLLGILQGVLLAALASFLGRLPGTGRYSDSARHEDVEPLVGVIAFRPEASLLYINTETILQRVLMALRKSPDVRLVACDLSASPYIDLAGARMLLDRMTNWRRVMWRSASSAPMRTLDSVLGESDAKERSGPPRDERPPGS